jgi:hypothetical protein
MADFDQRPDDEFFSYEGVAHGRRALGPARDYGKGYGVNFRNERKPGPRNWRRTDSGVLEAVSEALLKDPFVDARGIEVFVQDGVVRLEGSVESRSQRWRAEDVADQCYGVVDVENRLQVVAPAWIEHGPPLTEGARDTYSNRFQ